MDGLRSIQPLAPESIRGITLAAIKGRLPKFEFVPPRSLYVEEAYQREITRNGQGLIKSIIQHFSWNQYKTPVCVRLPEFGSVLVCIDGQHTATAAATHPDLEKIPVMIVEAGSVQLRAGAFVGHNTNRIVLTPQAIYTAELAAGDAFATMIDRAINAAGARIPRKAISTGDKQPIGTTVSLGTIKALAKRQGESFLIRVMKILVKAEREVIKADEISATAIICAAPNFADDSRLSRTIQAKSDAEWGAIARAKAAESDCAVAVALASVWASEMDVRLAAPARKGTHRDPTRALPPAPPSKPPHPPIAAKLAAPKAKPRPATSIPAPNPIPAAPPAPPRPASAIPAKPAEQPAPQNMIVQRNGVTLDLRLRTVQHRGCTVAIDDNGIRLVAALALVMPALLDFSRLEQKIYGKQDVHTRDLLRALVDRMNPILARAKLNIKTVPKLGNTLYDLGE